METRPIVLTPPAVRRLEERAALNAQLDTAQRFGDTLLAAAQADHSDAQAHQAAGYQAALRELRHQLVRQGLADPRPAAHCPIVGCPAASHP